MVERLTEWSQCCKTGEGRYNQGKFEEDSCVVTRNGKIVWKHGPS